jgi:hypothetical protein
MTRNEIKALFSGNKLELVDGSIVTVKSSNQEDETVTFQYDAVPKATGPALSSIAALGGFLGPKIISADGAISSEGQPVNPPVAQAELTTTVRCKWIELVGATRLP